MFRWLTKCWLQMAYVTHSMYKSRVERENLFMDNYKKKWMIWHSAKYEILYTWCPSRTCSFSGDDPSKKKGKKKKAPPRNTSVEEWLSCMIKTSSNALVLVTIPMSNIWTFGLKKESINGKCYVIQQQFETTIIPGAHLPL